MNEMNHLRDRCCSIFMASGAVLGAGAPDIGYSESDEIQLNEVNMHQLDD